MCPELEVAVEASSSMGWLSAGAALEWEIAVVLGDGDVLAEGKQAETRSAVAERETAT